MANRRFAVHEIRHVISRMRLGESDRQIATAGLMGRAKAGKLRLLAQDQGWLNKDSPLPDNEVIERLTRKTSPAKRGQSQVLPFANQVLAWAGQGIAWTTIHQTLVRKFAFAGSYDAVKCFLLHHKKERPATVMLDHTPGDVAQVDFGAGPKIIDLGTGEVLGTRVFVMTLA